MKYGEVVPNWWYCKAHGQTSVWPDMCRIGDRPEQCSMHEIRTAKPTMVLLPEDEADEKDI